MKSFIKTFSIFFVAILLFFGSCTKPNYYVFNYDNSNDINEVFDDIKKDRNQNIEEIDYLKLEASVKNLTDPEIIGHIPLNISKQYNSHEENNNTYNKIDYSNNSYSSDLVSDFSYIPSSSTKENKNKESDYSIGLALSLAVFFGVLGAHRYYLGYTTTGTVLLILSLFSLIANPFLWVLVGGWLLHDIVKISLKKLKRNPTPIK
ncbi:MAG: TM2 domain-containing protein [Cyclobacteriaceae bacterium]|nr:TM2 domain-containing protein [Cyclobacteriaceae bacterium]MCH8517708.1 TM2 domain-containing protein [Cyclobacteriaceae bacterium]